MGARSRLLEVQLHQREVHVVEVALELPVLLTELAREADDHVVGRAVGGPERAREGLVVEGHPVAAVPREPVLVERRGAVCKGREVRHEALEALLPEPARERRVVVFAHVGEDGLVAHGSDPRAAVFEEVLPVVLRAHLREAVLALQVAVIQRVEPVLRAAVVHLVARVARVVLPLGARVALRRHGGLEVEHPRVGDRAALARRHLGEHTRWGCCSRGRDGLGCSHPTPPRGGIERARGHEAHAQDHEDGRAMTRRECHAANHGTDAGDVRDDLVTRPCQLAASRQERPASVLHQEQEVQLVGRARHQLRHQVQVELPRLLALRVDEQAATTDGVTEAHEARDAVGEQARPEPAPFVVDVNSQSRQQRDRLRIPAGSLPCARAGASCSARLAMHQA
jgi:hypothetical protein